jgi:hypothetical protein
LILWQYSRHRRAAGRLRHYRPRLFDGATALELVTTPAPTGKRLVARPDGVIAVAGKPSGLHRHPRQLHATTAARGMALAGQAGQRGVLLHVAPARRTASGR